MHHAQGSVQHALWCRQCSAFSSLWNCESTYFRVCLVWTSGHGWQLVQYSSLQTTLTDVKFTLCLSIFLIPIICSEAKYGIQCFYFSALKLTAFNRINWSTVWSVMKCSPLKFTFTFQFLWHASSASCLPWRQIRIAFEALLLLFKGISRDRTSPDDCKSDDLIILLRVFTHAYLIFVSFFTLAYFKAWKVYTQKCVNSRQNSVNCHNR